MSERFEFDRVIHDELGRLPERLRAPLVLCYLEGLTHDLAARQLDCPVGTVRSRLARGRDLLHRRILRGSHALCGGAWWNTRVECVRRGWFSLAGAIRGGSQTRDARNGSVRRSGTILVVRDDSERSAAHVTAQVDHNSGYAHPGEPDCVRTHSKNCGRRPDCGAEHGSA